MAAIQRLQARETAMRVHATRVAVWGEAKDVQQFMDALEGRKQLSIDDDRELIAAMAAFGIVEPEPEPE